MDYKDISERIALLTQEIRDLQRMNVAYCDGSNQRISRASHEERELRLRQIKEELSKVMLKPALFFFLVVVRIKGGIPDTLVPILKLPLFAGVAAQLRFAARQQWQQELSVTSGRARRSC